MCQALCRVLRTQVQEGQAVCFGMFSLKVEILSWQKPEDVKLQSICPENGNQCILGDKPYVLLEFLSETRHVTK